MCKDLLQLTEALERLQNLYAVALFIGDQNRADDTAARIDWSQNNIQYHKRNCPECRIEAKAVLAATGGLRESAEANEARRTLYSEEK